MKALMLIALLFAANANANCYNTPLPKLLTSSFICKYHQYPYFYPTNGKTYKIAPMPACASQQYWLVIKPNGEQWIRYYADWGYYPPATITDCVGEKVVSNLLNKSWLWVRVK